MIYRQDIIFAQIAGTLAFLLTASVFFNMPAAAQRAKDSADFLLIEHVDQLLIYNRYQQRITKLEKDLFIPFVPIRILDYNGILSDNYTPCMKVELNDRTFYLIKKNKTTLIGSGKLGFNQVLRNATLLRDTVQLMKNSNGILVSPDFTQRFALQKKGKLIRYFRDNDLTYIRPIASPLRFGWAQLSGSVMPLQVKERDNNTDSGIPDKTLGRIEIKFREVNALLVNIFKYFNSKSYQKKTVPQWQSVESKSGVTYVLKPKLYSSYFPESDLYLTRDLDNILIGTVYIMTYTTGKIEIKHK